jgi:hypothetical protein
MVGSDRSNSLNLKSLSASCSNGLSCGAEVKSAKADLGLLVTLTMRRADGVQPHFCGTSSQATLKNLGWRFVPMAKIVYGLNQSLDG